MGAQQGYCGRTGFVHTAVATLYVAFQVFTTARVAANFITYGVVGLAGLGVALPVLYTVLVRRRTMADLGLTTRFLMPSVLLGLVLGADTYRHTVASLGLSFRPSTSPCSR